MSPSRVARWGGWLMGPAVIAAVVVAGHVPGDMSAPAAAQRDTSMLPECQHDIGAYIERNVDSLVTPGSGQVSIAGPITNVPEFHDCQRFVVVRGTGLTYDSLFAVFGAWDLGPRWDSVVALSPVAPLEHFDPGVTVLPGTQAIALTGIVPGGRAWGFVEVYAEGNYEPLGIETGFSCLYLYFSSVSHPRLRGQPAPQPILTAKMVSYGPRERDCAAPANPDTLAGTILQVRRSVGPRWYSGGDYPAAARWDWDSKNRQQYVAFTCGAAWCEAGPNGFAPSSIPKVSLSAIEYVLGLHRVYHIKGWFDEQQLADPTSGRLASIRGHVFPDPKLDSRSKGEDFAGRWVTAARTVLAEPEIGYADKLNLHPMGTAFLSNMAPKGMSRVDLCWGSWRDCRKARKWLWLFSFTPAPPECGAAPQDTMVVEPGEWWARIISARDTTYYCVRRRVHDLSKLPDRVYTDVPADVDPSTLLRPRGTVRWRWRANDETIWMSCDEGCCEVEAPTGPGG